MKIRNKNGLGYLLFLMTIMMVGSSNQDASVPNLYAPDLLSDENGKYSIYVAGTEISYDDFEREGINTNKIAFIRNESIDSHPVFEFEKEPAYAVFDTKGVVFKTYEIDELINFLLEELDE
ncbi:hypothetical protein [Robertmurraya kyonggiensis]|uniref:Uncharacterized protein n=1 Tax=Robertmurraya kyonggiensis TaxID=1037680 RepID=A0A4U1D2A5_9BACI|nr:hypothetical protein [Robertmurraya kyonggiensis]TKC15317.1 hypothetical protein FA727_17970 [Robertmurraya kyonggiensis]